MYISGSRSKNEYHYRFDIYVTTKLFPAASQKMDIISKNQYYQKSKCRFAGCKIHLCRTDRNARMSRLSVVAMMWIWYLCTYNLQKYFKQRDNKMDIISKNQYYLESKCRLLAADSFVQSRSECANVETFSSTVGQVWRHQVCTHLSKNHVIEWSCKQPRKGL